MPDFFIASVRVFLFNLKKLVDLMKKPIAGSEEKQIVVFIYENKEDTSMPRSIWRAIIIYFRRMAIRPMRNLKALHTWDAGLIVVENIRKN